jgi:glycosyltransferase involved in cell wall biosynthesis
VAVGRLVFVKGYDILIKSVPQLLQKYPDSQLWILGAGSAEAELKDLCNSYGLTQNVHFCGFQENPYNWLKYADLFVLSSKFEGLPNVLLEAIACGCPVIALEGPGGTREIMEATDQIHRFVSQLNWESSWFEKPLPEISENLTQAFDSMVVTKMYEKALME